MGSSTENKIYVLRNDKAKQFLKEMFQCSTLAKMGEYIHSYNCYVRCSSKPKIFTTWAKPHLLRDCIEMKICVLETVNGSNANH